MVHPNKKQIATNFYLTLFSAFSIFPDFEYKIRTPIPGLLNQETATLGGFVANLFQFGLAIVGLVAFVMLLIHGFTYVANSGNPSKVGDAQQGIWEVVWGVVLLIGSIVILNTINPCILSSINIWSSNEITNLRCQQNSGLIFQNNIDNTGPSSTYEEEYRTAIASDNDGILIFNTTAASSFMEVIYLHPDTDEVRSILIRQDGSYSELKINGNDYISITDLSSAPGAIHNHANLTSLSDVQRAAIEEKGRTVFLRNALVPESDLAVLSTTNISNLGRGISITEQDQNKELLLKMSTKNEKNNEFELTPASKCQKIGHSSEPYYHCQLSVRVFDPSAQTFSTSRSIKFYIEEPYNEKAKKKIESVFYRLRGELSASTRIPIQ